MPNSLWDNASTEKKIEILREDIANLSDAHNKLAWAFNSAIQRIDKTITDLASEVAEIRQIR